MGLAAIRRLFKRSHPGPGRDRRIHPRVVPSAGTTVLVVDDSATVRHLMTGMLRQSGYRTLEAADGARAIALARSHRPNLIFMDVMMPGMDGFQATRKLQAERSTQGIPVIIVSGNRQATIRNWVEKIGARGFLEKPFQRGEFFHRLERAIY